jgi:hypothetical protein
LIAAFYYCGKDLPDHVFLQNYNGYTIKDFISLIKNKNHGDFENHEKYHFRCRDYRTKQEQSTEKQFQNKNRNNAQNQIKLSEL